MTSPRILISGHLPPPLGGMATFYETLLGSSLPTRLNLRFVQTSSQNRELLRSGKFTIWNLLFALQDCIRFAWAVLSHRPQLCHIGTGAGLSFLKHGVCVAIARVGGSRVLLQPHCSFAVVYLERSRWWRWVFLKIIGWTNGVLTLSNEWCQLSAIIPSCIVYYIPNAVNLNEYQHIAQEHLKQSKQSALFRILYLGHLGRVKGTFDLLCAAQEISSKTSNVIFDLVGDEMNPGDREKLQEQIMMHDLSCVFLHPPASGLEKLAFFRAADVFVYPSYCEGMPMSVIEAMACGLPTVATSVGGLPDIVIDGVNGLLVGAEQPMQLAAAIYRLYTDHELCQKMQINTYQYVVEHHDIEKYVTRLLEIYRNMLPHEQQLAPHTGE
jgi:glycosyltransferase involved in cell wall biosynthesis